MQNNMPFSGPAPSSVEVWEGEDVVMPFMTDEERHRMAEIRRGVHHRLIAHRAIEETRKANALMWCAVGMTVPMLAVGFFVGVAVREQWGVWTALLGMGALSFAAVLCSGAAVRLSYRIEERFGKALWE